MWCKARRPDSCLLNVTWRVKQSSSKTFITLLLFLVFLTCMHSTVVWHVRVTVWQKIWITVLVIVVPSHHKAVICKFMFLFEYKTGHGTMYMGNISMEVVKYMLYRDDVDGTAHLWLFASPKWVTDWLMSRIMTWLWHEMNLMIIL